MKVIAYSLFGDPDSFEFPFYLRGIYFNARMNQLIYPEWITVVQVDTALVDRLTPFFRLLESHCNVGWNVPNSVGPNIHHKCRKMLWRMFPVFAKGVRYVLCRDADAITTYRESKSVERWL